MTKRKNICVIIGSGSKNSADEKLIDIFLDLTIDVFNLTVFKDLKTPLVAGIVNESDHYLHSSARDYLGTKGVLAVEILERPMSLEGYVFS